MQQVHSVKSTIQEKQDIQVGHWNCTEQGKWMEGLVFNVRWAVGKYYI